MKIGIYLNYIGLGANLLHLSYCHEIAKKYGPVTIITICKNLKNVLEDDPLIKEIHYIEKFNKSFFDIIKLNKLQKILDSLDIDRIPKQRNYWSELKKNIESLFQAPKKNIPEVK